MLSAVALLLFLSPALASASRDAREGADLRNVDGVRAVLSALQPGVTVRFSFGDSAPGDPISTHGHELSSYYGSGSLVASTPAELSNETLRPAVPYMAYISQGVVVVVQAG